MICARRAAAPNDLMTSATWAVTALDGRDEGSAGPSEPRPGQEGLAQNRETHDEGPHPAYLRVDESPSHLPRAMRVFTLFNILGIHPRAVINISHSCSSRATARSSFIPSNQTAWQSHLKPQVHGLLHPNNLFCPRQSLGGVGMTRKQPTIE